MQNPATDARFTLRRTFACPHHRLWEVWTQAHHLHHWFGHPEATNLHANIDLRPGGCFEITAQLPGGEVFAGRWLFRAIEPYARLESLVLHIDQTGRPVPNPFVPDWPMYVLSIVTFRALSETETEVLVEWTPYEPSALELKTFAEGKPLMEAGWGGSYEKLDRYLATL